MIADKCDYGAPWFHGSTEEPTVLRKGSWVKQHRELAKAFAHRPSPISFGDHQTVKHDGRKAGFLRWRITSYDRAAEEITGIPREQALGKRCTDVFHANVCESGCPLREAMKTDRPVVNKPVYIVNRKG